MSTGYKLQKVIIDKENRKYLSVKNMLDEIAMENNETSIVREIFDAVILDVARGLTSKGQKVGNVVAELKNFTYPHHVNEKFKKYYDRKELDDKTKRQHIKEVAFKGKETIKDKYNGADLVKTQREAKDAYGKRDWKFHSAEVDHVIPIKKIVERLENNNALTQQDLKDIANVKGNYVVINKSLNASKGDNYNIDYIEKSSGLNRATRKNMRRLERKAQLCVDMAQDKAVIKNIVTDADVRETVIGKEKISKLGVEAGLDIIKELTLSLSKALMYETKEIIEDESITSYTMESINIKFRIKRVTEFLWSTIKKDWLEMAKDFVGTLISSLVNMIIDFFSNTFRIIWKILKTSISAIISAVKLIVNPEKKGMTKAQAKDLALKLIVGASINVLGLFLDDLLVKIPVIGQLLGKNAQIITSIFTGILSVLVVYILDKADIFGAKKEQNYKRIDEIFQARMETIKNEIGSLEENEQVKEYMHRNAINEISKNIDNALSSKNYELLNDTLFKLAEIFSIQLPYKNAKEFIEYFSENRELVFE